MSAEGETEARPQSNLDFRLMSFVYKFRDYVRPRMNILEEVGIKTGFHVLDYGCGPGSYISPVARLVGESGRVYALDVHPLAVRSVEKLASRNRLDNVQTIFSSCQTGLPDESMDVILLYDLLHDLSEVESVLAELHRVLKLNGILSLTDHHLKEEVIISRVAGQGLFELSAKGKRTCSFSRKERTSIK